MTDTQRRYDVRIKEDNVWGNIDSFETLDEAKDYLAKNLKTRLIIVRVSLETKAEVVVYDQELEHAPSGIVKIRTSKVCKTREDIFADVAHKAVRQLLSSFLSKKTALTYELYHSQRLLSSLASNSSLLESAIDHLAKIQSSADNLIAGRKMEIYGLMQDMTRYTATLTDELDSIADVKSSVTDLTNTDQQSRLLTGFSFESTTIDNWLDKLLYYIQAYKDYKTLPGAEKFFDRIFSELLSWDQLIKQFTDSLPDSGTRAFLFLKICRNDFTPTESMNTSLKDLAEIMGEGDFNSSRLSFLLATLRELRKADQLTQNGKKDIEIHMLTKIVELLVKPDGTIINSMLTSEILLQRASNLTNLDAIRGSIDAAISVLLNVMPSTLAMINLLTDLTVSPTGSQQLPDITRHMYQVLTPVKNYKDLVFEKLSTQSRTNILLKLASKLKKAKFHHHRGPEFSKKINDVILKMLKETGVFQAAFGTHEPTKEQIPGLLKEVLAGKYNVNS